MEPRLGPLGTSNIMFHTQLFQIQATSFLTLPDPVTCVTSQFKLRHAATLNISLFSGTKCIQPNFSFTFSTASLRYRSTNLFPQSIMYNIANTVWAQKSVCWYLLYTVLGAPDFTPTSVFSMLVGDVGDLIT